MPLIGLSPKTEEVEELLATRMNEIRPLFKKKVDEKWGFGESDVIVNLLKCNIRDADPDASDVVILLQTNPNKEAEQTVNKLRNELAQIWIRLGLGLSMRTELWPQFVPGSWCLISGEVMVDHVDHLI